jgi:hypothetical protein
VDDFHDLLPDPKDDVALRAVERVLRYTFVERVELGPRVLGTAPLGDEDSMKTKKIEEVLECLLPDALDGPHLVEDQLSQHHPNQS